jgi:hypothetical protein
LWTKQQFTDQYRNRISGTLERLANLSDIAGPKFVFAHVMAVHPPYVFGPNGEAIGQATRVELDEGNVGLRDVEIQSYCDQMTYINHLALEMVDGILKNSAIKPVIILQGDHGSGIYMDWQSAKKACFDERKSILSAYYFPDHQTDLLYPSITPVNNFRVVLNQYFGANLPLLEDKNYFSTLGNPYNLIDVTNQSGICPFEKN